jgi:hypothetical protein
MTSDKLQSIWNRGKQREPIMDQLTIDRILDKSAREGWSGIRINVWVFLVMLVVSELFHILNLAASFDRPAWLAVNAVLALVTLGFLLFGLRVQRELRELNDSAVSSATLVKRQLRFFHTTFEWWAWMWSITVWMMSYCVVVWIEDQGGGYRVGHITEFAAISACVILGSYALMRLGHYPMVRRSLATLQDLESQVVEETLRVESLRRYWVACAALLVIALAAIVAWTIKLWLSAAP